MTLPSVTITQIDGALGMMPPSVGDTAAVIGPADSGPMATPVALAKRDDVIATFGAGPLVEMVCYLIAKAGKPVLCVRTHATTEGSAGTIDVTDVKGTSEVTLAAGAKANDEYEVLIKIVEGGTIGTDGITYQWSLDAGRTLSRITALGVANSITVPASGGVKFELGDGTLVSGDVIRTRTTAPMEMPDDLAAAYKALTKTHHNWDVVFAASVFSAVKFAAIDTWMQELWTAGKHKKFLVNTRGQALSETPSQWQDALATEFGSSSSLFGAVCAGHCKILSAVSSMQARRPIAWPVAAWALRLRNPRRDDMAAPALGALPSDVRIIDTNGNPDEHDEATTPGLDDARFLTLRSFEGLIGTYLTRPRIFAPVGSDFVWWQYRSVINAIADVIQVELTKRLRSPVRVDRKTGYILEQDAADIEGVVNAAVEALVGPGPDVSAHKFTVSRTDQILATGTINCAERVVPLAYPDQIGVTIGFVNPARAQAV